MTHWMKLELITGALSHSVKLSVEALEINAKSMQIFDSFGIWHHQTRSSTECPGTTTFGLVRDSRSII